MLRPGDKMLCVTGTPYDTIQGVIGMEGREEPGSLKDFGIEYEELDLRPDGTPDLEAMEQRITPEYKMIYIQRSRGYSLRPSLRVKDIAPIVEIAKRKAPPGHRHGGQLLRRVCGAGRASGCGGGHHRGAPSSKIQGAELPPPAATSPDAAIWWSCVPTGLTTPGTGRELGCTLGNNRELFMGAFHAPHVAGEALKTAVFASALFSQLGFGVTPTVEEKRGDIIQVMLLEKPENLIAFCKGVQKGAPGGFLCGTRAQRYARL